MPTFHIVRETTIHNSFRVSQMRGMFDYQNLTVRHEWNSELPIEQHPWKIGLIVGASGSGKTTLAREAFSGMRIHESFKWSNGKAVVDDFPAEMETKEILGMMNSVGFSSTPHWFKPFSHLSNGQKFRVELARCILENKDGLVFDEFTSVVDRDVAKIGCVALAKALRKKERPPFVAVSCHYDIIDWLDPDWVFDVGSQSFEWRLRRRRPPILIEIHRASPSAWEVFREHHYLDHAIHKGARCFVATWQGKPVGFTSYLHFPHPRCKTFKREHRTVVLPDFQGVGIGNRLSEFVAQKVKEDGNRFISTTSNPAMIHYRSRSPLWKCHRFGRVSALSKKTMLKDLKKSLSNKRISAGFEYLGNRDTA